MFNICIVDMDINDTPTLVSQLHPNITNVWLDCDPGLDDAFAIILAAGDSRLNLIGISTSSGNTTIEHTTKNAADILFHIGKSNIPVYMGSSEPLAKGSKLGTDYHGEKGLGGVELVTSNVAPITENSFALMHQRILQTEGKIVFICTGALTNLALLLHTFPDVKQKISMVSLMGGAIGLGNQSPAAEFNIYYDPIAAKCVFDSNMNIVMIPLEVTHTAIADTKIVLRLQERTSSISKALINMLLSFKEMYKIEGFEDPPLHDPCAVYYVIDPEAFVGQKVTEIQLRQL